MRVRTLVLPLAAALAVAAAGATAGCGYSTRALVPDEYRTIAVPVFGNDTRRHDLEIELTRSVVEEIQARTHLRIVREDQEPDLVLRGRIDDIDEETLSRRQFQRVREGAYFLTAAIDVTDRRAGREIVTDEKVHERASYVPDLGESVRTARAESVKALAERIVRTLEASW